MTNYFFYSTVNDMFLRTVGKVSEKNVSLENGVKKKPKKEDHLLFVSISESFRARVVSELSRG